MRISNYRRVRWKRSRDLGPVSVDNPVPPTTGLVFWIKADSLSLNDGDYISPWKDSTGGADLTGSGGGRPVFKTNIIGSKPIARYTAANASQVARTGSPVSPTANSSYYALLRVPSNSIGLFLANKGPDSGVSIGAGGSSADNNGNNIIGLYGFVRWIVPGHAYGVDTPTVVALYLNSGGTNAIFYHDNAYVGTYNGSAPNPNGPDTILIGESYSRCFTGDIAEILIYSGDHSSDQTARNAVYSYIRSKYRI